MNTRLTTLFFLAFLGSIPALAAPKFGMKLGQVDFRDWKNGLVLKLADCKEGKNVPVQEMKLTVEERKVHVDRIKLVTHSGEQIDIKLDKDIKSGTDPEWFKIGEKPACISVLRIIEDDNTPLIPEPTRAVVDIWGR